MVRLALRREHAGIAHGALHAFVDRAELRSVEHAVQRHERDGKRDRALDEGRAALLVAPLAQPMPAHELHPSSVSDLVPE